MEKKTLAVKVIKGISSDPRVLRFVASTEDIDRDGDVIDVAGWNLEEWNKNSVIMWSHDYSLPPIAKGVRAEKDIRNKQLLIDARFPTLAELAPEGDPSEHAKFIETIYQLYANDILHAVSVGCSYDKIDEHKELDSRYSECRYHVLQETLMELSCCSIGANPSALRAASATPGIEKSVLDMVVKSMDIEEKAAIAYHKYPLADEGAMWDGPKVVADSEIADLKQIATWYDSSKSDADLTKGDFKLPHHMTKADSYKTVWKGVAAAYGALMGSRGGVKIPEADVEKCKSHLAKHYADFSKDVPEDKTAWVAQCKAMGFDDLIGKEAAPIVTKVGARLSSQSLAHIDNLEKCVKSMKDEMDSLNAKYMKALDHMSKLREGASPEEPSNEPTPGDGEKSAKDFVFHLVR